MKTYLQKLISTAMLSLTLFSASLPAWAGHVNLPEVIVGTDSAAGSMAGARYSADSTQYIGCNFSNTNGPSVACSATDKTGKVLSCVGYNTQWPAAMKTITDFSYIYFSTVPGGTYCKFLRVDNFSFYLK
jgi:hypothetical protein